MSILRKSPHIIVSGIRKMLNSKNFYRVLCSVTIIFLLFLPYILFQGKLFIGGDDTRLLYSYPDLYFKNAAFFSWANVSTIGINSSSGFLLPFLLIWSFLDNIIQNKIILSYLAFSAPLILGFIFFQKFIQEFFEIDEKEKNAIFLGAIFYIFSPILIIDQLFIFLIPAWLIGVVPGILYFFIRYLKTSRFIYVFWAMLFCLIFSFCFISIPWIAGYILPVLIGLLVLAFFSKKSEIIKFVKHGLIFSAVIIISQAFWLINFVLPYIISDRVSNASKIVSEDFLATFEATVRATAVGNIFYPLLGLFHRQLAFAYDWKLKDEFLSFYDKTYLLNLVYVLVLAVGIFYFRKAFNSNQKRKYIFILTSFIFSLYFFTLNIGPLKEIFLFMGNIPGFVMFRNFYDKFAPGYVLLYSILFTLSLFIVKSKFKKKYGFIFIALFCVILLNFTTVKSTVNSPMWTTKNIYKTISMPTEYIRSMEWISKNISPTNTIISIPFSSSIYTVIKDENSNNVYAGTSPVKIFSGVNDISGDMSFNFTDKSKLIYKILLERKYKELNQILFDHNVNYVLVTKNVPEEVANSYIYYTNLVKMQDETMIASITSKKIFESEKGNYVIYETKNKNTLFDSKNITFKKINNVEYKISIKNITSPQQIIFNDSFHPGWKMYLDKQSMGKCEMLYFSKEKSISECKPEFKYFEPWEISYLWSKAISNKDHTTTDGYSNIWTFNPQEIKNEYPREFYKVNPDGSMDLNMTMYFRPQAYFYLGLIISILTILGSVMYLIWLKNKR